MFKIISPLLAAAVSVGLFCPGASRAQTLSFPANASFFTGQPPSLVDTDAVFTGINDPNVPYHFSVEVPAGAVESLGQISLHQQPSPSPISFALNQTQAFLGLPSQPGATVNAQTSTSGSDGSTILVSFDPPIAPGNTVTVTLMAQQNPAVGGVYQFRVQAFPAGPAPVGMDLGVGRLQFYENR